MINKAITILTALLLSSNCFGADWWVVQISEDRVSFIDMESIKDHELGNKKSWIQAFNRDRSSMRLLFIFNCKDEELGIKANYLYNADGKSDSSNSNSYIDFKPAAPETVGHELLKVSCADDPQSQLDGDYQGPLKEGVSPEEFSKKFFDMTKKEKLTKPKNTKSKG